MMASSSSSSPTTCFLQHQLAKPLAGLLMLGLLVLVAWVAVGHIERVRSAVSGVSGEPLLGVQLANPDELVARMFSFPPGEAVLVSGVLASSPAQRAGLRRGDGITAINGQTVRSTRDVAAYLSQAKQGDLLSLTVIRGGFLHDVLLPLGGAAGL